MSEHRPLNFREPSISSSVRQMGGESRWRLEDVIDFEFLLDADQRCQPVELERRDRAIYRNHIALPGPVSTERIPPPDRRRLFRQWLEARRREDPADLPRPGAMLASARRLLTRGLAVLGLVLGAGAAAHFLRYDGVQPVNVAAFFAWLVLLQLLLMLAAAAGILLRRSKLLSSEISLLTGVTRWIWTRLAARLDHHALARMPAERRAQVGAFLGMLAARGGLYRSVLTWPLVGGWQVFGIGFNAGVIGVTLALVLFSDRAFGWQSAVQVSAVQVHDLIHALARPWAWLFPEGTGYPTLAQVEGSRIILKDGIRQLATEHLVSWWPFLCLATVTYGWLPRVVFYWLSGLFGRRALDQLSFQHAACDRLYERLLADDFQTQGKGEEPDRRPLPDEAVASARALVAAPTEMVPENGALLLGEPELLASLPVEAWRPPMASRFHLDVFHCQPVALNPPDLTRVLGPLTHWRWRDGQPKIIVLQEAWEPPIAENVNALRLIRKTLGPSAKILVALIGRPQGKNPLTPVKDSEWKNWERSLGALGDPKLRCEALVHHA